MTNIVTRYGFNYDLDNEVDFKKYLTVDLLRTQLESGIIEDMLNKFVNVSDSDYELDEEDSEENEYVDDFAGDINNEYTDKIKSNFKDLTPEDIDAIHGMVDENKPVRVLNLSRVYITEDELSEHKYQTESYNPTSKKMVQKEYTIPRADIPQYVKSDDSNVKRLLVFNWEKILRVEGFNQKIIDNNLEHINSTLIDQKSYLGILDKIINDYNYMINEYPEFGYKVFAFRSRSINEKEKYDVNNFVYDIAELINDNKFRSVVSSIDDSVYKISLDEDSMKNARKIVEDLRVSDECNKIYLKTGLISRLLIPIINDYVKDYQRYTGLSAEGMKYLFNYLTLIIFNYCCRYISAEFGVNALNKLYKIVDPRVKATQYSNQVIWRFLEGYSIDSDTAVQKFTNKIIRTILPKIDLNRSCVSFLEVVIRNMITSDFRYNFAYTHKTINVSTGGEDDDASELDKVALTHYHKSNEMDDAIVIASIHRWVKEKRTLLKISDEEVHSGLRNIKTLNEFQIALLNMYYNSIFPTIDKCGPEHLVSLIIILKNKMEKMGMEILPKLLLGKRTDNRYVKNNSGRVTSDIMKSKNYQEVRDKFTYIRDKFDRDAFLFKLVSVNNFDFVTMNLEEEKWVEVDKIDKIEISEEIFEFANICSNL